MKWGNTLMAYEEDVKNRSFWDWMKAHTSGFKPLHRYEGVLKLNQEKLTFTGTDVKEDKDFNLEVPVEAINDVQLGFDKVFSLWEERSIPWNKPLRIRYETKGGEETVYLFAGFHYKYLIRTSDNKEVYEELEDILK